MVVLPERPYRQPHDFRQGRLQHLQFVSHFLLDHDSLGVDLLGAFRDVQRMIGDPLQIGDRMEELVNVFILFLGQFRGRDFDDVGAV